MRGLKFNFSHFPTFDLDVAPRAGAWIEIDVVGAVAQYVSVAPRAGAWIEIKNASYSSA